jgi:hypothetical protein
MSCTNYPPDYLPRTNGGLSIVANKGDGYSVRLQWDRAFKTVQEFEVGYNIYYSTVYDNVFSEGPKLVSTGSGSFSDGYLQAEIIDLTPGEMYYFAVRAFQYDPDWYDPNLLPSGFPGLKTYPEAVLLNDITDTDDTIRLSDIELFPAYGIIQVGTELIRYTSKDLVNESVFVNDVFNDRGFVGTNVRYHNIDGYDGVAYQDPIVKFWKGFEEENARILQASVFFTYPNYAYTIADGYKTVDTDILTTDLSATEVNHESFSPYDYAGWHRTDPTLLLSGGCLGTYIGGELYCADGYNGVGRQLRGVPINEQSHQRLEIMLETDGEPCILLRRQRTGIRCSCYLPTAEYPEHRCPNCHGTGFVLGYEQYFNQRRSDGRILIRFGAAKDDLKVNTAGLESEMIPDCWTLVTPPVKDRDIIWRFDEDGNRTFAYEILDVTRNKLFLNEYGAQKFTAQRVRKTDPIYQVRAIDSTATIPEELNTSIGLLRDAGGGTLPHTHTVTINENTLSISQINQTTSISAGHNHSVVNGTVQEALGHTHTLII